MKIKKKLKIKIKKTANAIREGRKIILYDREQKVGEVELDGEVIFNLLRWEDKTGIKIINLDRKNEELILE